jgi:transaldolase/glucose-6-phosphate isomerase
MPVRRSPEEGGDPMNPLRKLHDQGQAVWLDFIRRGMLAGGGLTRLIEDDGLTGVTSNPSIFQQAIAGGSEYDDQIAEVLAADPRASAGHLYEALAVEDIRTAADQLRGVWDATAGADGYVSLEVSPYLAHDTEATIDEARRLWRAVDRPNLMIKVPGTDEGVPAFEALIAEGINVNVTLMFSLATYEAVAQAYLRGLSRAAAPETIASVASFFVSRVDTYADAALEEIGGEDALALRGRTAIANAKLAYRRFEEIFHGEPFAPLAARGARPQRVLWASTSTKNPAYRDVVYVEELIGSETVNTLPPATLEAFRDHGGVRPSLTEEVAEAEEHLARLAAVGVDLDEITDRLQRDGVEAFAASFDSLLAAVEGKRRRMLARRAPRAGLRLGTLRGAASRTLQRWQDERLTDRLWARDVTLFAPGAGSGWAPEIADRLGWLALPESMHAAAEELTAFAAEVSAEGVRDAVVLGMGGSSLAPEVFGRVFGGEAGETVGDSGRPRLTILDTTHPDAVRAALDRLDPAAALFVISSKSGTTVETDALFRAAWERTAGAVAEPGRRFVAITDPGSALARLAEERGFRRLVTAPPDVGGRYSALTPFGLLPAALAGADPGKLLDRAFVMAQACAPGVSALDDPALALGAAIAAAAAAGRDKLTLLTSPALESLPAWIEQLVAESLGKDGRGVVPVAGEPLADPDAYGDDRLFVALRLAGDEGSEALSHGLAALAAAGHPVVEIELADRYDLGSEMFRWELATAAAGAALGVQPFDQPDVEEAKRLARGAMAGATAGSAPQPIAAADESAARAALERWLDGAAPGGYLAIQAYLAPTDATADALAAFRRELAARTRLAVTAGWGPRFLHSTGQLHKGGPDTGRFLQLLDRPAADLPVPGRDYTFGRLIHAQAAGDAAALAGEQRPLLRLDLGTDPAAALRSLAEALATVPA